MPESSHPCALVFQVGNHHVNVLQTESSSSTLLEVDGNAKYDTGVVNP